MLPKQNRLRKSQEIKETLKEKRYTANSALLYLVAKPSTQANFQIAVVTPKKLGQATSRNRIRRKIKGTILENRHKIGKNLRIVVFPRETVLQAKHEQISQEFVDNIEKIRHRLDGNN